jgi:geranylgeranyl diphosphate synthase type II
MKQLQEFEVYAKKRFAQFTGPSTLLAAIDYSFFAGGKRVRPLLMFAVASLNRQHDYQKVFPVALALEMVHTYSLIHDDLPAIDNDDLRRGVPTSHRAFGEATALLAGDALLSQSFEVLAEVEATSQAFTVELIVDFAQAIGEGGMVGGQIEDVLLEQQHKGEMSLEQLQAIHALKTGQLLTFALLAPLKLYDYPSDVRALLMPFADHLGTLFQAIDDYLDDHAEIETGKTRGSDSENNKITYLSFMSRVELKDYIAQRATKARQSLHALDAKGYDTALLQHVLELVLRQARCEERA